MNIIPFLLSNWRYVLIAVLAASALLFYNLWRDKVDEFDKHLLMDKVLTEQFEKEKQETEDRHRKTLEDVSNAWDSTLPRVRQNAVGAYCRRYGCGVLPGGSSPTPLPGNAPGSQVTHGTCGQQMDSRFVEDCAQDALKVELWREWAMKNRLRIE